jgi:hypothetical protein
LALESFSVPYRTIRHRTVAVVQSGGKSFSIRILAVSLLLFGLAPGLHAAPADELKTLVEQGKSADAYRLGEKHPDLLGDPAFDYYFGVAAIDTGHAGVGVLALERFVINSPGNINARLELARGYFALGDDARARDEFDFVAKSNPPAAVQANIDRFLDAIRAREIRFSTVSSFFVEAGYGYDSNVSGGVSNSNISLPVFGTVLVNQAGVKAGSSYSWVAAGGQVSKPIAPGLAVFGAGQVDGKYNNANNQFDQNNVAMAGGLTYLRNKEFFRATLSRGEVALDDARFRDVTSVAGEWHHQFDDLQTVNPFIQYAQLRYADSNQPRDSNLVAGGVGYRKAWTASWQPQLNAVISGGSEHDIRDRPDLGRELYGARVTFGVTPRTKWSLVVGATYLHSRYGFDPTLQTSRKDNFNAVDATVSYAYTRNVSVRVEMLASQNASNLDLYAYRRNVAALKIRYEFK